MGNYSLIPLLLAVLLCVGCDKIVSDKDLFGASKDFSGTWKATNVTDTVTGATRKCKDASIDVTQTSTFIRISTRDFFCADGAYVITRELLQLDVAGENLTYQGRPAGTLQADNLNINFVLNASTDWRISIQKVDKIYKYVDALTNLSTIAADVAR